MQLLYARRRYQEAEELFDQALKDASLTASMAKIGTEPALRRQEKEQAMALACQTVVESKDYHDHVWLGRMLWSAGQHAEAEVPLRHALRLADHVPDTWVALIHYLAQMGRKAEAEAQILEAQRKLPPDQAPLALAACYVVLGRRDQAEEQYRAALKAKPNDVWVRRSLAQFYLQGNQLDQARPLLRFLYAPESKAPPADAAWARRSLALALAATGDDQQFLEALALVELNLQLPYNSGEDLRAKAFILATRSNQRGEAIRHFEELNRRQALWPTDQFLLAQLYEASNDWPAAKARLDALLTSVGEKVAPHLVASYVGSLLRHGETDAARPWCDRLEMLEPGSLRAVEMRVRLLKAQDRTTEAILVLNYHAQRSDAQQGLFFAGLLEELGQPAAAEELYQRFGSQSKQPENIQVLIGYLSRQKRFREALELCERAWQTCSPDVAGAASLGVLRAGAADAEQERVEHWLRTAIEKNPTSIALLADLANLRDLQGRYDEAKALYRQILERDQNQVLALNNLARLLAATGGKDTEALRLVQRAVGIAGPRADLLDTRAFIHLTLKRSDLAITDLKQAVAANPTALLYLRLAQAYQMARKRSDAAVAFQKAQALGLEDRQVHPAERQAYLQLLAYLDPK
jgi:tetratricopeptide (TPR) repeat protein